MLNKREPKGEKVNLDEQRLREITEFRAFYEMKLKEENTDLGKDLIQVQIQKLDEEKEDILKRCNAW